MSQNAPSPNLECKAWLSLAPWELVVSVNEFVCQQAHALHKPTSDGYEPTKKLWEEKYKTPMTFPEMLDFLCQCHRMAPFCNYNGNTFVSIAKKISDSLKLSPMQSHLVRTVAGHIVAGTVRSDEKTQLLAVLSELKQK